MSIRLGSNIIAGGGQTRYIQQPTGTDTATIVPGGIVRTTTGFFFANTAATNQTIGVSTSFSGSWEPITWDVVAASNYHVPGDTVRIDADNTGDTTTTTVTSVKYVEEGLETKVNDSDVQHSGDVTNSETHIPSSAALVNYVNTHITPGGNIPTVTTIDDGDDTKIPTEGAVFRYVGALGVKDSLTSSDIPQLGAGKIDSGQFNADRIPQLDQSKINNLTSDLATKRTEAEVDAQLNELRTSSTLLTFPNGETFSGSSSSGTGDVEITTEHVRDTGAGGATYTAADKLPLAGGTLTGDLNVGAGANRSLNVGTDVHFTKGTVSYLQGDTDQKKVYYNPGNASGGVGTDSDHEIAVKGDLGSSFVGGVIRSSIAADTDWEVPADNFVTVNNGNDWVIYYNNTGEIANFSGHSQGYTAADIISALEGENFVYITTIVQGGGGFTYTFSEADQEFTFTSSQDGVDPVVVPAGADEITSHTLQRNNAGQTEEEWIAAGGTNTADNFVADPAFALNYISLARGAALLSGDNYSEMIIATAEGNNYHNDLLYFEADAGRLILRVDTLIQSLTHRVEIVSFLPDSPEDVLAGHTINVVYLDNAANSGLFRWDATLATPAWVLVGGSGSSNVANGTNTFQIPVWNNDTQADESQGPNAGFVNELLLMLDVDGSDPDNDHDRINFVQHATQTDDNKWATTRNWQEAQFEGKITKYLTGFSRNEETGQLEATFDGSAGTGMDMVGNTVILSDEADLWTNSAAAPPNTLGADGDLGIASSGTSISRLYVRINGAWKPLDIDPTNIAVAGLAVTGASSTDVGLFPQNANNDINFTIGPKGQGNVTITDVTSITGDDTGIVLTRVATMNGAPINALEKIGYFLGTQGTVEGVDLNVTYTIDGITGRYTKYTTSQGGENYDRYFYSGLALGAAEGEYIAGAGVWANHIITDPQTETDFGAINLIG